MVEVIRSWWQFIKIHRINFQFVSIFLATVIILILIGYLFDWTGFNTSSITVQTNATKGTTLPTNITVTLPNKTLYDWLQLLIIPFVIAASGYIINFSLNRTERYIALDRQHEATLKEYIDKMSEFILHLKFRLSEPKGQPWLAKDCPIA